MAKISKFILLDDGFIFKGRQYSDTDITNIRLSNVNLDYRYGGLVHAADVKIVTFELSLKRGEKLKIKSEDWDQLNPAGIILSKLRDKDKERNEVFTVYQQLCQRTFRQRQDFYLSQLNDHGYFIYDECKFYPSDKIVFRGLEFRISESQFINHGNGIEIRRKGGSSIREKLEFELTKYPQFMITTDTDVIRVLLDKFFGMRL